MKIVRLICIGWYRTQRNESWSKSRSNGRVISFSIVSNIGLCAYMWNMWVTSVYVCMCEICANNMNCGTWVYMNWQMCWWYELWAYLDLYDISMLIVVKCYNLWSLWLIIHIWLNDDDKMKLLRIWKSNSYMWNDMEIWLI